MSRRKESTPRGPPKRNLFASLRLADMVISKPLLSAEVLVVVLGYLPAADLIRFARVSRRLQEMVYDDAVWIRRLDQIHCWNEAEARKNVEALPSPPSADAPLRSRFMLEQATKGGRTRADININGHPHPFVTQGAKKHAIDGFDSIAFDGQSAVQSNSQELVLTILKHTRSQRGQARQEYGKIYKVLAPFYHDILSVSSPSESKIFRAFVLPEQQAQMFAQVKVFSRSDPSPGSGSREIQIGRIMSMFESTALLEFRKGYEYRDVQGRMKQYADVLYTLNGGSNCVDLYLNDNQLISARDELGSVGDCVDYSMGSGQLSLERVHAHFERLGQKYQQEAALVQAVFPQAAEVSLLLLEKISNDILSPFLTELFAEARSRSQLVYLRVISGSLAATKQFVQDFALPSGADEAAISRASLVLVKIFEPHLDAYLHEEVEYFRRKAEAEVDQWARALSEQAASTETFLMSNLNRQADKKDFMSSFKKVVMMPVNILPSFSSNSHRPSNKLTPREDSLAVTSRATTPTLRAATPNLPIEAPSTELAAKAALMNSRLENIKSLFSIEVALSLVHAAKSSLERAAQFIALEDARAMDLARSDLGGPRCSAREQCSTIFVSLLDCVGNRHVESGFDKAIEHLSQYNPRDVNQVEESRQTVAPLTTFLELVNVGDLIQQMLDVFFEQEIVGMGICKRDDFLNPSIKGKRRFEAMLDEKVASGLGKGIDVLMDEVEYLCATEQSPNDFNPAMSVFDASESSTKRNTLVAGVEDIDISPTPPCLHIIQLIDTHVGMLVGSTDKSLLDVFVVELGSRLFQTLTKHIKRQRISPLGAMRLLSDLTQYAAFISRFKNTELNLYFNALREVGQIYLFEGKTSRELDEMAGIMADAERYRGIFTVEEVVEFAERRSDWLLIRSKVEGKVRGDQCTIM